MACIKTFESIFFANQFPLSITNICRGVERCLAPTFVGKNNNYEQSRAVMMTGAGFIFQTICCFSSNKIMFLCVKT